MPDRASCHMAEYARFMFMQPLSRCRLMALNSQQPALMNLKEWHMRIGIIGLGVMGTPIALRLLHAGMPILVWNRSSPATDYLRDAGATVASSVADLCAHSDVILLALRDAPALDAVLERGTPAFATYVSNRMLVQLGTTAPSLSLELALAIEHCGGRYVEAPVSGSRMQAEQGQLISMFAGAEKDIDEVEDLLVPICREAFGCGLVPQAMRMKLAINHFLIVMVTALAEAVHAAQLGHMDLQLLQRILDAGPMASTTSRIKLAKLVTADYKPQAAIRDVRLIAHLVARQAHVAGAASPLIDICCAALDAASAAGDGDSDMVAVVRHLQAAVPEVTT